MKIIISLLTLVIISTGCSQKKQSSNELKYPEESTALQPIIIDSTEGFVMSGIAPSLTISNPELNQIDFGSIAKDSGISTYTYVISNPSYGTSLKGGTILIDASSLLSPYSVKCYNGLTELASEISCTAITLKKGSSAKLSVRLDSTNLTEGTLVPQVFRINDYPLTVKSTITGGAIVNNITIGVSQLDFNGIDPRLASANQIINVQTTSKLKAVSIQSPAIGNIGTKGFKVILNTCLIPFKGSCQVTVGFDGSSAAFGALITDGLLINNSPVILSATTINPPVSKLIPVVGVSDFVNLGTIYLDEAMPSVPDLKFKITSLSSSYGEYVTGVSSDSTALSVNQNCPSPMTKSTPCSVSASLNSALLTPGQLSIKVILQSAVGVSREAVVTLNSVASRNSSVIIPPTQVACTLSNAIANGVVVANSNSSIQGMAIGSDISSCILSDTACNPNHTIASNKKSCNAEVMACNIADALSNGIVASHSNMQVVGNVVAGDKTACLLASNSCDNNYSLASNSKSCEAIVLSCSISDAVSNGVVLAHSNSTVSGNVVAGDKSGCLLASNACNINYSLASGAKSCDAIVTACSSLDAQANGVDLTNSNSSVVGNVVAGDKSSCLLASNACNANYSLASSLKSCEGIVVACTLSDAQSNGANITSALTAGGNKIGDSVSSCIIDSCSSSKKVLNNNSCVDTIRNCLSLPSHALTGTQVITNIVSGNHIQGSSLTYGTCSIASCDAGYNVASDNLTCDLAPVACTAQDAKYNLWDVKNAKTISGTLQGASTANCVVSACHEGTTLSNVTMNCLQNSFNQNLGLMSIGDYDPTLVGEVYDYKGMAIVRGSFNLADGSVIYYGEITSYSSIPTYHIIKIKADKTLDLVFNENIKNLELRRSPRVAAKDSNENMYFANDTGGYRNLIKINSSGLIDETFMNNQDMEYGIHGVNIRLNSGLDDNISAIAIDSLNNVYLGGHFSYYMGQASDGSSANPTNILVKLSSQGILDKNFTNTFTSDGGMMGGSIETIALDETNSVLYVGGDFQTYGSTTMYNAPAIAKFSLNGVFDSSFSSNVYSSDMDEWDTSSLSGFLMNYGAVTSIQIDSTKQNIYVAGSFIGFKGIANNAKGIAKLSKDGIFNQVFSDNLDVTPGIKQSDSGISGTSFTIKLDAANNVYGVGRRMYVSNSVANSANGIYKLDSNGVFNTSFSDALDIVPGIKNNSSGINVDLGQAITYVNIVDSKTIEVGGYFDIFRGVVANSTYRLSTDGQESVQVLPATTGFNNIVYASVKDTNGNIYMAGAFTSYNGKKAPYLIKMNRNGVVDSTFMANYQAGVTGVIQSMAIDSSNNIYVGGGFNGWNGINYNANRIAKFNSNGVFDANFSNNGDVTIGIKAANSGFNAVVLTIAVDPTSTNIYVGGSFTSYKGVNYNAMKIAKLSTSGVFDQSFSNKQDVSSGVKVLATSGFLSPNTVNKIIVDNTGTNIYVAGSIITYKGTVNNARRIAKFTVAGDFDTSFSNELDVSSSVKAITSGFNYESMTLAMDTSNNIYVGGSFTNWKGISYNAMKIAKISSLGVMDSTFSNNLDISTGVKASTSGIAGIDTTTFVRDIVVDGTNLYVVGYFNTFKNGGYNAKGIAKISTSGVFDTSFSNNLDIVPGVKHRYTSSIDSGMISTILKYDSDSLIIGGSFYGFKGTSSLKYKSISINGVPQDNP